MKDAPKWLIEFVCTGNSGRSPIAEAAARQYLREVEAHEEYEACSSGTSVNHIKHGVSPSTDQVLSLLEKAVQRGDIFTVQEERVASQMLKDKIYVPDTQLYPKVQQRFHHDEVSFRTDYALEKGLGEIKTYQEQTVPRLISLKRTPVKAIFGMEKRHSDYASDVYKRENLMPAIIAVLPVYATGNPNAEIPNTFGGTREEYYRSSDNIIANTKVAINKVLGTH